jgi:hypothetical protein
VHFETFIGSDHETARRLRGLAFIDETWTKTNMIRSHGRAPCGKRPVDAVPHWHWKTSTFIGALRCDGLTATGVFDGDQRREVPCPDARSGGVVIMDNLRSYRVAACARRSKRLAQA